jgi:8-amino-7-oxononanoate synthase
MNFKTYFLQLQKFREQGLIRNLREVQGAQGRVLTYDNRNYLNFSSNNYLGLAESEELRAAFKRGVEKYGVGSGASRLINGSMAPFHQLERALAEFKQAESALLFNSGYHANLGALSSLIGEGDIVFSDELNHASMIDGIRLSKASRVIYRHNNLEDLRKKLKQHHTKKNPDSYFLIATESVFSMDGDLAPLHEIAELAHEFQAILYVDEAHATGVFGKNGTGLAEELNLSEKLGNSLIQMGTLGKALGCFGAYVAGPKIVIEYLIHRARSFIYTTALPPAIAEAALESLKLVTGPSELRKRLWKRIEQFKIETEKKIPNFKIQVVSPIIPIVVGSSERAMALSQYLFEQGIWVNAIRPSTVPEGTARLRVTLMATHTEEDVSRLVAQLEFGMRNLECGIVSDFSPRIPQSESRIR